LIGVIHIIMSLSQVSFPPVLSPWMNGAPHHSGFKLQIVALPLVCAMSLVQLVFVENPLNAFLLSFPDWWFESRHGLGIFLFTTASRPALGPTQPHIQWVPGALSLGVKRPGREANHSPPSSAEVKEWLELYLYSPNTPPWRGAQLKNSTGTTLSLPLYVTINLETC
jgi:hypothetical protein